MAKLATTVTIDTDLREKAKEIASQNNWNLSTAVEMGLKWFIATYAQYDLVALIPVAPDQLLAPIAESPEVEQVAQ